MNAIVRAPKVRQLGFFERILFRISPRLVGRRVAARQARNFDAASRGRRTSGWGRSGSGPNATNKASLVALRNTSRDLQRNNGWARRAGDVIGNNTIGWGIQPRFKNAQVSRLWKKCANSTACDHRGRQTFYGLTRLVMDTVVRDGEALVIKHQYRPKNRKIIPLRLEVLEPDYLDTEKYSYDGARILQGVEFDSDGQRVAYWLFPRHPGELDGGRASVRVPASDVLHVFREDRPGQVRGITWYAAATVRLNDFGDFEDAVLMRTKMAACFTAFVTDMDGESAPVGEQDEEDDDIEQFEPGLIQYLKAGQNIEFPNLPTTEGNGEFTKTSLHGIAASLGVSYEDLVGDYASVSFSAARMSRLAHWANVHQWRWNMIIPQFLDPVWGWFEESLALSQAVTGEIDDPEWNPPPMPMIEPDKEGLAYKRLVRSGLMTHDQMILEQGGDPETHWEDYAEGLKRLDKLKILLDSDPRKLSDAGQLQQDPSAGQAAKPGEKNPLTSQKKPDRSS